LKQVPDKEAEEVAAQVVAKGLVRKVATQNGVRYEITDAGWRFIREYQDIDHDLAESKSALIADDGSLVEKYSGPPETFVQRPVLLDFLSDPRRLRLQYEVIRPEVGIVIPTLNEAKSVGNILTEIPLHLETPAEVLMVDASYDETPSVASKFGVRVLRQNGLGKGSALRQAFCALDSDIIVMIDGDGSMQPQEVPSLVQAIIGGADMVKGSRFLPGGYSEDLSFIRKVGNLIFVSLVNMFWSATYTDICYGLMAFRRSSLERLKPDLKSHYFQIETEICIKAKKLGMKVVEVPSAELRRMHGKSKLVGIRDSLRILRTIVHEMRSAV
jgi:GT2 family glycosyltransferase